MNSLRLSGSAWLLTCSAETYLVLVRHRGWSVERYAAWLERSIRTAVAGSSAASVDESVPVAP